MQVTIANGRFVFSNKDRLKALGFKWFRSASMDSGSRKGWVIKELTPEIEAAVAGMDGVSLAPFAMDDSEIAQVFRASRARSAPAPASPRTEEAEAPASEAPVSAPVAPPAPAPVMAAPAAPGSVAALEEALARARAAEAAAALPPVPEATVALLGYKRDRDAFKAEIVALKAQALNFLAALESLERKVS